MLDEDDVSLEDVKAELEEFIKVSVVSRKSVIDHISQCLSQF